MNTTVKMRFTLVILFVLLLVLSAVAYHKYGASKGQKEAKTSTVRVEVLGVKRERIPDALTFAGDLEPKQRATITAKVSGILEKMYVQEGDYVQVDTPVWPGANMVLGLVIKEKRKLQRLTKGLKKLDAEVGDKGLFAFRWPVERIV